MRRGLLLGAILSLLVAAPVSAAPPPNDTLAGAINVPLGATLTQSTDEATTDAFEQALADFCGPPAANGAVWVEFTPDADGFVAFDVTESDYSAGVFVYQGTPVAEEVLACGPGVVTVQVTAGETYNLMLIGDTPGEPPNELVLTIREAEGPPDLALSVGKGTVDKAGNVLLTGTVTCSSESGDTVFVDIFGDLTQRVGRLLIRGFFGASLEIPCDGSTFPWEAFVVGDNGLFAGGKAAAVAIAFGCTDLCTEEVVQTTIQLRRGGK